MPGNLWVIASVFLLDQLTKFLAVRFLPVRSNAGFPLAAVLGGLIIFLGFFFALRKVSPTQRLALALILGGGLSNLFDRLDDGLVVDFINLGISTLNLADLAIFLGIATLLNSYIRTDS